MLAKLCKFGAVVALASAGAMAAPPTDTAHIAAADVLQSLHSHGIEVGAGRIELPLDFPARAAHPALELVRIEAVPDGTSRALFRCTDHTSCIPFYVVVRGLSPEQRANAMPAAQRATQPQPPKSAPKAPPMVKKGAAVKLQIATPDMVISLPVICMENGRQGERIHVTSTDRKNTYMGEVVSAGMLRAQL